MSVPQSVVYLAAPRMMCTSNTCNLCRRVVALIRRRAKSLLPHEGNRHRYIDHHGLSGFSLAAARRCRLLNQKVYNPHPLTTTLTHALHCSSSPRVALNCVALHCLFSRVLNRQIQDDLTDAALKIPEYYYAPIHAYADGNLCWDSAMEVQTSNTDNAAVAQSLVTAV